MFNPVFFVDEDGSVGVSLGEERYLADYRFIEALEKVFAKELIKKQAEIDTLRIMLDKSQQDLGNMQHNQRHLEQDSIRLKMLGEFIKGMDSDY